MPHKAYTLGSQIASGTWKPSHNPKARRRVVAKHLAGVLRKMGGRDISGKLAKEKVRLWIGDKQYRRMIEEMVDGGVLLVTKTPHDSLYTLAEFATDEEIAASLVPKKETVWPDQSRLTVAEIEQQCRKALPVNSGHLEIRFDPSYLPPIRAFDRGIRDHSGFGRWVLRHVQSHQERILLTNHCGPYGLLVEAREVASSEKRRRELGV